MAQLSELLDEQESGEGAADALEIAILAGLIADECQSAARLLERAARLWRGHDGRSLDEQLRHAPEELRPELQAARRWVQSLWEPPVLN
jgi:hypothetical protein